VPVRAPAPPSSTSTAPRSRGPCSNRDVEPSGRKRRQAQARALPGCHHGTIFLDEIGLLPGTQSKLLKVIEGARCAGSTGRAGRRLDLTYQRTSSRPRGRAADLYHRLAVLCLARRSAAGRRRPPARRALQPRACTDWTCRQRLAAAPSRSCSLSVAGQRAPSSSA
jgi:hypothetical protein